MLLRISFDRMLHRNLPSRRRALSRRRPDPAMVVPETCEPRMYLSAGSLWSMDYPAEELEEEFLYDEYLEDEADAWSFEMIEMVDFDGWDYEEEIVVGWWDPSFITVIAISEIDGGEIEFGNLWHTEPECTWVAGFEVDTAATETFEEFPFGNDALIPDEDYFGDDAMIPDEDFGFTGWWDTTYEEDFDVWSDDWMTTDEFVVDEVWEEDAAFEDEWFVDDEWYVDDVIVLEFDEFEYDVVWEEAASGESEDDLYFGDDALLPEEEFFGDDALIPDDDFEMVDVWDASYEEDATLWSSDWIIVEYVDFVEDYGYEEDFGFEDDGFAEDIFVFEFDVDDTADSWDESEVWYDEQVDDFTATEFADTHSDDYWTEEYFEEVSYTEDVFAESFFDEVDVFDSGFDFELTSEETDLFETDIVEFDYDYIEIYEEWTFDEDSGEYELTYVETVFVDVIFEDEFTQDFFTEEFVDVSIDTETFEPEFDFDGFDDFAPSEFEDAVVINEPIAEDVFFEETIGDEFGSDDLVADEVQFDDFVLDEFTADEFSGDEFVVEDFGESGFVDVQDSFEPDFGSELTEVTIITDEFVAPDPFESDAFLSDAAINELADLGPTFDEPENGGFGDFSDALVKEFTEPVAEVQEDQSNTNSPVRRSIRNSNTTDGITEGTDGTSDRGFGATTQFVSQSGDSRTTGRSLRLNGDALALVVNTGRWQKRSHRDGFDRAVHEINLLRKSQRQGRHEGRHDVKASQAAGQNSPVETGRTATPQQQIPVVAGTRVSIVTPAQQREMVAVNQRRLPGHFTFSLARATEQLSRLNSASNPGQRDLQVNYNATMLALQHPGFAMQLSGLSDAADHDGADDQSAPATYAQIASATGATILTGAAGIQFGQRRGWSALFKALRRLVVRV